MDLNYFTVHPSGAFLYIHPYQYESSYHAVHSSDSKTLDCYDSLIAHWKLLQHSTLNAKLIYHDGGISSDVKHDGSTFS